jgi:hypothetical protein
MAAPLAQVPNDGRRRPVVFSTRAEQGVHHERRRPLRVLMWITIALVLAVASVGLAVGGSAVWSVVGPKAPSNSPAPLWIEPPTIAVHKLEPGAAPTSGPRGTIVPIRPAPGPVLVGRSSTVSRSPLTQDEHRRGGSGSGSRDSSPSSHDG